MKLDPKHASLMAYADQRYEIVKTSNDDMVRRCRRELERLEDPVQVWMLMRMQMCRELRIPDDSPLSAPVELLADMVLRRAQEEQEKDQKNS